MNCDRPLRESVIISYAGLARKERLLIARVRVLESSSITPTIHSVRFEKPPGFRFAPVQFCGLEFPTDAGSLEYPMSLACSPTRPYLEFGARLSASPWKKAFAALQAGDEAEIDGAYGHFLLDENSPAVLVAGGIGITPLKGMAEYAADRSLPIEVRMIYSSRTEEEMAYRSELIDLEGKNPNFRVVHTLTRVPAASGWKGNRGRIGADLLSRTVEGLARPVYYLCGGSGMVEETYRILRGQGISEDHIRYEVFRGYS